MSFYSELNKLYVNLNDISEHSGMDYSVFTIIQMLLQIEDGIFNEKLSSVSFNTDGLEIRMYSKENRHIPVFISIFKNNVIDIQVDSGGEYLYLQSIQGQSDIDKIRATMNDLLTAEFCAQYFKQNNILKKVIYTMPYLSDGLSKIYRFGYARGSLRFWNKTETIDVVFEPWIK